MPQALRLVALATTRPLLRIQFFDVLCVLCGSPRELLRYRRLADYTRGIAAKHIKRGYTLACQWAGPALQLPVAASFGVSGNTVGGWETAGTVGAARSGMARGALLLTSLGDVPAPAHEHAHMRRGRRALHNQHRTLRPLHVRGPAD